MEIFKCEKCNKEFDSWFKLNGHITSTHTKPKKKCSICEKEFYFRNFKKHYEYCLEKSKFKPKNKRCELCNNLHDGTYGSGRFCSQRCSRSFSTSKNREEISQKASKTTPKERYVRKEKQFFKILFYLLFYQTFSFSYGRKWFVSYTGRLNISKSGKNRTVSNETRKKLSDRVQERLANGTFIGWQNRTRKYSELFFDQVLKNNNLFHLCKIEYRVVKRQIGLDENGNYYLDFYFPEKHLNLEIDGKQHFYPERMIKDIIRDHFLKTVGKYKVYRIAWKNPNTVVNKLYIKKEIDKFLEYYHSLSDLH